MRRILEMRKFVVAFILLVVSAIPYLTVEDWYKSITLFGGNYLDLSIGIAALFAAVVIFIVMILVINGIAKNSDRLNNKIAVWVVLEIAIVLLNVFGVFKVEYRTAMFGLGILEGTENFTWPIVTTVVHLVYVLVLMKLTGSNESKEQ